MGVGVGLSSSWGLVLAGGVITGALAMARSSLNDSNGRARKSGTFSVHELLQPSAWIAVRQQAAHWQHTREGILWEQCLGAVALVSCLLYVGETYVYDGAYCANENLFLTGLEDEAGCRTLSIYWKVLELGVTVLFGMDYILQMLAARNLLHRIVSVDATVDALSILPGLTVVLRANTALRPELGLMRLMRAVRILRLRRLMQSAVIETLLGRSVHLVFTIFTIIFLTSAVIHTLGQYDRVAFEDASNELSQRFWFHDAVYFVVVTITTIGYGDVSPSTAEARMITVASIVVTFAIVPTQFQKVLHILELQSTPYNRSFVPANTQSSAHVLITGDLDATNVALFLRELFHEDHFPRNRQLKAVLLTPTEPSDALKALVESAQYAVCTVCLKGSPLNDRDLARACAARAEAVFVLTDHRRIANAGGGSRWMRSVLTMDEATLLRTMSIRSFVGPLPVITQVMLQRDELMLGLGLGYGDETAEESTLHEGELGAVLTIQRIKESVLAKSLTCPGFSTLVNNLVCSMSAPTETKLPAAPSVSSTFTAALDDAWGALERGSDDAWSSAMQEAGSELWNAPWEREYSRGCTHEIYRVTLTPRLAGQTFVEAAACVYAEFGALLFAMEDYESGGGKRNASRVLLNPGPKFTLEAEADGFILCTNQEVASEIVAWASGTDPTYEQELRKEVGGGGQCGRDGEGEYGGVIELVDCSHGGVYTLRDDGVLYARRAGGDVSRSWPGHRAMGEAASGGSRTPTVPQLLRTAQEFASKAAAATTGGKGRKVGSGRGGGGGSGAAEAAAEVEGPMETSALLQAEQAVNAAMVALGSARTALQNQLHAGGGGVVRASTGNGGGDGGGGGSRFWTSAAAAAAECAAMREHVIVVADVAMALHFVRRLRADPHRPPAEVVVLDELATEEYAVPLLTQSGLPHVCCVRASLTTSELAQLGSAAAANVVVLARCLDDEHMVAEARGKSALVDAPVLRLCTAALAEGWNGGGHGGGHSGGSGGWVPKQMLLEVVYESNVKFCGTMSRKWAVRGAHFMAPAFAAGMVFVSATMDHLTCQTFYNRHLLAIVSELAEGGTSARMRPQSQLLQVRLTNSMGTGYTYRQLVSTFLHRGGLVPIGLYRPPGGNNGASLPYTVTNPAGDTTLTDGDRIFVLAPPQEN